MDANGRPATPTQLFHLHQRPPQSRFLATTDPERPGPIIKYPTDAHGCVVDVLY